MMAIPPVEVGAFHVTYACRSTNFAFGSTLAVTIVTADGAVAATSELDGFEAGEFPMRFVAFTVKV